MFRILRIVGVCLSLTRSHGRADRVDNFVEGVVEKRKIAGLSLAIIDHGQIVKRQGME